MPCGLLIRAVLHGGHHLRDVQRRQTPRRMNPIAPAALGQAGLFRIDYFRHAATENRAHTSPIPMEVLNTLVEAVRQYGNVPSKFPAEWQ